MQLNRVSTLRGVRMRIGLIDIEPKIFNTAYMQIAYYHKQRGDTIGWWSPLTDRQFDHVYCSSLFDFTDKTEVPARAICGGTGFDVASRLSAAIEACNYDYSIYSNCKTSYLWFSRGCVRDCPWCVVRKKEGDIHSVRPKNINSNGKYITVMDNNFFESGNWWPAICQLKYLAQPVDFQGIDVRTITDGQCQVLNTLRHYKQIKIAWDNPKDEKAVFDGIARLTKYVKPYKIMCYVLIGFNSTEQQDLYRVETLRNLGIDPFVMPYNKSDLYQKAFARWVNHKAIFKKVKWEDYISRVYAQETAGCGWHK